MLELVVAVLFFWLAVSAFLMACVAALALLAVYSAVVDAVDRRLDRRRRCPVAGRSLERELDLIVAGEFPPPPEVGR